MLAVELLPIIEYGVLAFSSNKLTSQKYLFTVLIPPYYVILIASWFLVPPCSAGNFVASLGYYGRQATET